MGIWPDAAIRLVERPAQLLVGASAVADPMLRILVPITRVAVVLFGLAGVLALVRRGLLRRREVTANRTWGCGYESPTPRMQYTGSSFAEPVLSAFEPVLNRKIHEQRPAGYFPRAARHEQHSGDHVGDRVIRPAIRHLLSAVGRLRVIQHGRVQLYLLYILVTLIVVLVWQLSGSGP
jgi:hypothetical protein